MLPKKERIKYNGLFQQCYQKGKKVQGELLKIFYTKTRDEYQNQLPFVGVSIGTSFDKRSVIRNKIRRRLIEIYKEYRSDKKNQEQLKKIGLLVITLKGEFKKESKFLDEYYSQKILKTHLEELLTKCF